MNKEEERICELVRKNLRKFPLYKEDHNIFAKQHDKGISISYRTTDNWIPHGTTNFDIQFTGNICYILWIEIIKEQRGKNYCKLLYRIIENISRDHGCDRTHLTPSGWTPSGKTRLEYMIPLGYKEIEKGKVEKILNTTEKEIIA